MSEVKYKPAKTIEDLAKEIKKLRKKIKRLVRSTRSAK